MTQAQKVFADLERFRAAIRTLSQKLADDREFWSAYADRANRLEASCPLELRDYVKDSILRVGRSIGSAREAVGRTQTLTTETGGSSHAALHA